MLTFVSDWIRVRLTPANRKRLRRLADPLFSSIGSIHGAREPCEKIAITFDDGPDDEVTPRLLDLLREREVKATFFVLTDKAAEAPDLVRRMVEEGHEVGLHFDRHDRMTKMPLRVARQRVIAARERLEGWAGPIRYFRPPFGAQTLQTFMMARSLGLEVVAWGPYAEDWVERTPAAAAARGLENLKDGDILLLHDGLEMPEGEARPTFDRVRMVELLLDGLAERSLSATTVGGLVAAGQPRLTAWFRL